MSCKRELSVLKPIAIKVSDLTAVNKLNVCIRNLALFPQIKPGFHLDFFCLLLLFVAFRTNKMPQRAMRCSNGNIHKKPKRATKSHNEQ